MSDPFHSSRYKIDWAKRRFSELQREIKGFMESEPYAFFTEPEADGKHVLYRLKLVKPMPDGLAGLTSEVVGHLRSALDQAVYAVKPQKNAYFPIGPDSARFENSVRGWCKHLPSEITNLLRAFKPYKGGDNLLWALNELCNTDKHATICPFATATTGIRGVHLYIEAIPQGGTLELKIPHWDSTKNEMVISRHSVNSRYQNQFEITVYVAVRDIEFIKDKPVLAVLHALISKVESIVMAIEAEASRLGLP